MAQPLYKLLQGKSSEQSTLSRHSPTKGPQLPSRAPIEWIPEHQMILEQLVDMLTNPPVLANPDFEQPFVLHTDASERGLGPVLYQRQDGRLRVIGTIGCTVASWRFWCLSGQCVKGLETTSTTHHTSPFTLITTHLHTS